MAAVAALLAAGIPAASVSGGEHHPRYEY